MRTEFDSKPVYGDNDKYIKTKIKIYAGSVNTNFQDKKMPKEKVPCKSISIIMLDSVGKAKKKHYPQISTNTFWGVQIWTKKGKNGQSYWWWLRKKFIRWVR